MMAAKIAATVAIIAATGVFISREQVHPWFPGAWDRLLGVSALVLVASAPAALIAFVWGL